MNSPAGPDAGLADAGAWLGRARPELPAATIAGAALRLRRAASTWGVTEPKALVGLGRASLSLTGRLGDAAVRLKALIEPAEVPAELDGLERWSPSGACPALLDVDRAEAVLCLRWVEGTTLRCLLADARPQQRSAEPLRAAGSLLRRLARIEAPPGRRLPLAPRELLARWRSWLDADRLRAGVHDADALLAAALDHLATVSVGADAISHGDPGPDNILCLPDGSAVALDPLPAAAPLALILARAAVQAVPSDPEAAARDLAAGAVTRVSDVIDLLPSVAILSLDDHRAPHLQDLLGRLRTIAAR